MSDPAPAPVDKEEDDEDSTDGGMEMYEYVGCYTDRQDDRVLGDKLDSDLMTADVSIFPKKSVMFLEVVPFFVLLLQEHSCGMGKMSYALL